MSDKFGVNLWWTCPEFVMDGEQAQAIIESNGFEPDQDLPLPSRRKVVSRAAYSFQDRRHKDGRKVTEKAREASDYVVYGILSQKRKGAEEVGYDQGTTVRLDKESGRVEATGDEAEDFYKALGRYTDAITDDDVRDFLRKVVGMCFGISKRPSGGIYFVPDRFVGVIESAQQVLEDLNIGAKLYVERVMNGEQERAIVWEAVEADIDGQIDKTLKAVERIEKRVSSVQSHEAKLDELNGLMDIYRSLLGQEAKYEELAERLEAASNKVASILDAIQSAQPKKGKKVLKALSGNGVGIRVLSVVDDVLKAAGKPLHYREIAKAVAETGFELRGNDQGAWLNSWIAESFRRGENRYKRLGKGLYEVA